MPEPLSERFVRALAGTLGAGPWFDSLAVFGLHHWFFPTSRLWAAARTAHGDADKFYAAVPMPGRLEDRDRLAFALARFEEARAAVNAIEAEWHRDFFGEAETPVVFRVAVEGARHNLRHAYNATRRHFRFLLRRKPPRARSDPASPDDARSVYGSDFDDVSAAMAAPTPMPEILSSHAFPGSHGAERWLRFRSPSRRLGDDVYARVHEPAGVADPPTVLFGHGICVEFDHWRGLVDETRALVAAGCRVIRPEAPWHGRRVTPGYYGGERIIATFPMGILDALTGAVQEWAVLADWVRRTSRGPLGFAGSSLGALTSQLAATAAHDWPERLRPDALLLITHSGDLGEAVLSGTLAGMWSSPEDASRKGWTEALARQALSRLEPQRAPAVPARRIVSVLGRRDAVLPFASGQRLIEQWCLPEENVFIWNRGHFSVPMSLIRDKRPVERFVAVLRGAA